MPLLLPPHKWPLMPGNTFANLTGLSGYAKCFGRSNYSGTAVTTVAIQHRLMIGNRQNMPQGPPSEGSNDDA
ncbi:Homeobox protein unc-4, partial [Eumeta japonica]